jgi:hypothetical protein
VVTGSSEGDRGDISQWLNDGSMMVQWQQRAEEERGDPFKGRTRRWPRAAEMVGGSGR